MTNRDRLTTVVLALGLGLWLISVESPTLRAQSASPAGELVVAAASDLQAVLPEVARRFQQETGTAVKLSFGSSGNFFAQIQNGAPFDVFFSADIDYPKQLVASKHAERDTLYEYATGRIVLWTRRDSGIDVQRGLQVLRDARVRRIAIANPAHAPYGRAAVAALRQDKVYDAVKDKLVLGENISQAAQFADSGNADVGIIARSLALGPTLRASGVSFDIPSTLHPPIEQGVVVLSGSRNQDAARRLIAFLKRADVAELLRTFGFTTPQPAAPATAR